MIMSVPEAPIAPSLPMHSPPFQVSNDPPPEYIDEPSTDTVTVVRMDEQTHSLIEAGGSIPESRTRKACKMMCVTTNSALMVIAWTIASTFFSGIGAYWVWATFPGVHVREILIVTFYPMSAALLIALLLSPVFAVAGDVRYGNFRLMLSVMIPVNVLGLIIMIGLAVYFATTQQDLSTYFLGLGYFLVFLAGAIFQTNAIQLGSSVLGDFNSPERGALVHWYYWATNVPAFCFALILYPTFITSSSTALSVLSIMAGLAVIVLLIFLLVTCVVHCVYLKIGGWSRVLPLVRGNPFKQVFRVTRYAIQTPARPGHYGFFARLSNTRRCNGGQVNDEEVDNVTKFWLLVLLMVSLCGFFFWDDMWAVPFANVEFGDSNLINYYLSSQATTSVIVFICVPIYQLVIRPLLGKHSPPILWRILVGLILQLISLPLVTWSVAMARSELGSQVLSDVCTSITNDDDSYYTAGGSVGWFYLVLPQVINGFSQLLVFPAVIELILTDAPRVMQGLLIGIWYAMQSIHVVVSIIETAACIVYYWPYYMVKIALVLASTIIFAVVAHLYKRRQVAYSFSTTQGQGEVGVYRQLQEVSTAGSTST